MPSSAPGVELSSTFPEFREALYIMTYTHPENVIAQWTIEWGVPLGLLGLTSIAFALRPSAVLARSSTATGAWCAIVCVAVQNLVDLGSGIPGLVLALVVCSAIVVGGTAGRAPRNLLETWGGASWALVTTMVVGVASCAIAALAVGSTSELRKTAPELTTPSVLEANQLRARY